ncbi:hypothetical protein [Halobaculum marinum]|uniref:Uncharacterized protein n=1 Tax=Halobaculum marinum TaxID=3031996 RepID=A0ABD5WR72_9EURY|nr:hypothetical protein [Halobaculum sp. DT55]
MTLADLIVAGLEAVNEIVRELVTLAERATGSKPDEQNTPPVTPSAKAIESWPTEEHDAPRQVSPPFQGHSVPLGGGS